jgi:bifunctional non-homologous end joining protein LigD
VDYRKAGTRPWHSEGMARFVVQEHHATNLHWDFRLERHGVAPSWAVPKGVPEEKGQRRLAVQVDDHTVAHMRYQGSNVKIWDEGDYDLEKWEDDKIVFELHGKRLNGRYALIRTDGKNWLIHRTR